MDSTTVPKASDPTERNTRLNELLAHEYQYLTQQFIANEEMGEKRVSVFLTLTAGLGAAAMLASKQWSVDDMHALEKAFLMVLTAWRRGGR